MHTNLDSIFFLSHGLHSKKVLGALRGEMANALKLLHLLQENGYPVKKILDIYEVFGDITEVFEPLAFLNCSLAESGYPVLEEVALQQVRKVAQKILRYRPDALFILSWNYSVSALFATGIQKKCPVASKLYVSNEKESVWPTLYTPSTLLLTESLLANQKAIEAGLPPWKLLHLPNHYPTSFDALPPDRSYVETLIRKKGKKIPLSKNTHILGTVARLEYGKNVEYALEAVKALVDKGEDLLFVLKGDFEQETSYPVYKKWLQELLGTLEQEQWLLWDKTASPFSEIGKVYASFDLFLHLSGSEAGSNVIVEALACGKPTVILEGSTNPSLFRGGAIFVPNDGTEPINQIRPFTLPCRKSLEKQLETLLEHPRALEEWGKRGRSMAEKRFSPQITLERFPLLLRALHAYHHNLPEAEEVKMQVERLYQEDLKRYE